MTIPLIRKRAKRPKTHTGCVTCRARHIKCDEAKPSCLRCVKSNRLCEGYTEPRKSPASRRRQTPAFVLPKPGCPSSSTTASLSTCTSLSSHRSRSPSPSSSSSSSSSPPQNFTLLTLLPPTFSFSNSNFSLLTPAELSALDFFRQETAHALPGSAWSLSWPKLALRVVLDAAGGGAGRDDGAGCGRTTAITHVAIALGAMHRAEKDGEEAMREFALTQYGKAMGGLRAHILDLDEAGGGNSGTRAGGIETVLLVSLLFFCFEVWNGDDVRAGFHLKTGLKILCEWYRNVKGIEWDPARVRKGRSPIMMEVRPRNDMCLLMQTFVRLDGDMSILSKGQPCLHPMVQEPVPEAFASLEEALVHLDVLTTIDQDVWSALTEVAMAELEREGLDLDPSMMICLASARARCADLDAHPTLVDQMTDYRGSIKQCMSALVFVPVRPEEEAAYLLVQIQLFVLWFDSCAWREVSEMFADKFERQFDHMIGLAERYVNLHKESSWVEYSGIRPAISVGTGLVAGICIIAFHCRVASIRRRCMRLLREVNLRGVFDSNYLIALTQALIDLEVRRAREILGRYDDKDLLPSEIPAEARVIDLDLGGRLDADAAPFYKNDSGQLIFAMLNSQGVIEVDSVQFTVERYV